MNNPFPFYKQHDSMDCGATCHFLPKSFEKWNKMLQKSDFLRKFVSFYDERAHHFVTKMYHILTKMFQKRTKTSQNVNYC